MRNEAAEDSITYENLKPVVLSKTTFLTTLEKCEIKHFLSEKFFSRQKPQSYASVNTMNKLQFTISNINSKFESKFV